MTKIVAQPQPNSYLQPLSIAMLTNSVILDGLEDIDNLSYITKNIELDRNVLVCESRDERRKSEYYVEPVIKPKSTRGRRPNKPREKNPAKEGHMGSSCAIKVWNPITNINYEIKIFNKGKSQIPNGQCEDLSDIIHIYGNYIIPKLRALYPDREIFARDYKTDMANCETRIKFPTANIHWRIHLLRFYKILATYDIPNLKTLSYTLECSCISLRFRYETDSCVKYVLLQINPKGPLQFKGSPSVAHNREIYYIIEQIVNKHYDSIICINKV